MEIAAPPVNLLGSELVRDLVSLMHPVEAEKAFRVLVFKSADPDYFISHVGVTRIKEYREEAALSGRARGPVPRDVMLSAEDYDAELAETVRLDHRALSGEQPDLTQSVWQAGQ